MRTAAILPVKRFASAKQRLGASVVDALRTQLARAMAADVLLALGRVDPIERTIVVTGEPAVASAAVAGGALVVGDAPDAGQSAAVALGIERALREGFERVLCIPGDCPLIDPVELRSLLRERAEPPAREVVILPDRHGTGTNGLLLAPADAIPPSFGPGSCARHRALARAAGAPCRVEPLPSLLLDIDTGDDLTALRDRLARATGDAPHTRAVLGGLPGGVLAGAAAAVTADPA